MLLFIDRLPFYSWVSREQSDVRPFAVPLPIVPAIPGSATPPPPHRMQCWCLDTGFSGEAVAWRHHLEAADPQLISYTRKPKPFQAAFGEVVYLPVCAADLWLFSNLPGLQDKPYRLSLDEGIAFHDIDRLPDPRKNVPLLGMRALEDSGMQVDIDFRKATVSVWIPAAWHHSAWHFLRSKLPGNSPLPTRWTD